MVELNLAIIKILAASKIILLVYILLIFWSWRRQARPVVFMLWTGLSLIAFYLVLAWPLQKMWWGTQGDELYIVAFLEGVLSGNWWSDFYYAWLPNFYPPLYFWLTGLFASLVAHNAIVAAKIGISMTLFFWFFGSFFGLKWFWSKIYQGQENKPTILSQAWFWWLWPILYLLLLDFDTILLKPYEAVAALFLVLWLMLWASIAFQTKWPKRYYWFFGLSGGLLFLLFYFWWLIVIPVLLVLALSQNDKLVQIKRLLAVGLIIFVVATPYLLPLFWSWWHYGMENWLAVFFVPTDFLTFNPWSIFSVRGLLWLGGLAGLIWGYQRERYIKACAWGFLACYCYQALGLLLFVFGFKPMLPFKPFMFLGSALAAVGLAYILIYIYKSWQISKPKYLSLFVAMSFLVLLTQAPFTKFIDDPVTWRQIEKDLVAPADTINLAAAIKDKVPDYDKRTWLSSGQPALNAYLPLSYYLAHNIHFSHQASLYSRRLLIVKAMANAVTPDEFMAIVNSGQPRPIDALLFSAASGGRDEDYILYFWVDNYPNSGREEKIYLPKRLISDKDWREVYNENNWIIFLKK